MRRSFGIVIVWFTFVCHPLCRRKSASPLSERGAAVGYSGDRQGSQIVRSGVSVDSPISAGPHFCQCLRQLIYVRHLPTGVRFFPSRFYLATNS